MIPHDFERPESPLSPVGAEARTMGQINKGDPTWVRPYFIGWVEPQPLHLADRFRKFVGSSEVALNATLLVLVAPCKGLKLAENGR